MRTTKALISLRIRAVWSAPLLFTAWIVLYLYFRRQVFSWRDSFIFSRFFFGEIFFLPGICILYKHSFLFFWQIFTIYYLAMLIRWASAIFLLVSSLSLAIASAPRSSALWFSAAITTCLSSDQSGCSVTHHRSIKHTSQKYGLSLKKLFVCCTPTLYFLVGR